MNKQAKLVMNKPLIFVMSLMLNLELIMQTIWLIFNQIKKIFCKNFTRIRQRLQRLQRMVENGMDSRSWTYRNLSPFSLKFVIGGDWWSYRISRISSNNSTSSLTVKYRSRNLIFGIWSFTDLRIYKINYD